MSGILHAQFLSSKPLRVHVYLRHGGSCLTTGKREKENQYVLHKGVSGYQDDCDGQSPICHAQVRLLRPTSIACQPATVLSTVSLSHGISGTQSQQARMKTLTCRLQHDAIFSKASKEAKNYVTKTALLAHCRALHVPSICTFHGRSPNRQAFRLPCRRLCSSQS